MKVCSRKLVMALTPLLVGQAALAGDYTFTTGAEYTIGDYDTGIDTSTWYVPFTLSYAGQYAGWSLTVPYIRIDGSSLVSGTVSGTGRGGGRAQTPGTTTLINEQRVDSGLGDIQLSAILQLQEETPAVPWVAVRGKVKFGTADEEKFLGTGETDYAIQVEAAKGMVDGLIGYNFLGDTDTIDFADTLYGAAAVTLPLQQPWRTRTELYLEESALAGLDPIIELTISFSRPLVRGRHFSLYAVKGFSDSSPDWGVGTLISHSF